MACKAPFEVRSHIFTYGVGVDDDEVDDAGDDDAGDADVGEYHYFFANTKKGYRTVSKKISPTLRSFRTFALCWENLEIKFALFE